MAARTTQVAVEVLRSSADAGTVFTVSGSHAITFGYTATRSTAFKATASHTITFAEIASALRCVYGVASNTVNFAGLASATRGRPGIASTLLLLSYSAGENGAAVAAATNNVNLHVASGQVRDLFPSASTSRSVDWYWLGGVVWHDEPVALRSGYQVKKSGTPTF